MAVIAPLSGIARKISLIFIGLSFVSWMIILVTFALLNNPTPLQGGIAYPYWLIVIGGIPLMILAVAQSIFSTPSMLGKFLTAITTFFSVFYMTALGMLIYVSGVSILGGFNTELARGLFSGSFFSILFWGILMMLWPFYDYKDE